MALSSLLPSSEAVEKNIPPRASCKNKNKASAHPPPLILDPISEYRALEALSIYFTVLLNRQLRRRWLLEHTCMQDKPVTARFRPVILLEPVPSLHKPRPAPPTINHPSNPHSAANLAALKQKVTLLRARVEKGKELVAEIERRRTDPRVLFPTHFCHTCVADGGSVDVLLTTCGHRVCRTCLSFGAGKDGEYECSICFAPTHFVARSPLSPQRTCSGNVLRVVGESMKTMV
ncbi:hypothetical protein N7462_005557 [Penicillium macrosclerotiorum]|uniref:uncharacterized protein n=1 Tax=Penicillium macrosclerotiorum TaxID=303699 RepID=UPI0025485388|nr:uncharacterized protein N7462_005557 [Penicillium macrosclerotiorum]KAJ5682392.1 hypothetical protein N7462_005557 [Penicillium macrosclerotiorum]